MGSFIWLLLMLLDELFGVSDSRSVPTTDLWHSLSPQMVVTQKDINVYPGWVVSTRLGCSGKVLKRFRHVPTGTEVKSVPGIVDAINKMSTNIPDMQPQRVVRLKLAGVDSTYDSDVDEASSHRSLEAVRVMEQTSEQASIVYPGMLLENISDTGPDTNPYVEPSTVEALLSGAIVEPPLSGAIVESTSNAMTNTNEALLLTCNGQENQTDNIVGVMSPSRLVHSEVHMSTLRLCMDEFLEWKQHEVPGSNKSFSFLGKKDPFVTQLLFNYSQCLFYCIKLPVMVSKIVDGSISFISKPLAVPFNSKLIGDGDIVLHTTTSPSPYLIYDFAAFSFKRRDLYVYIGKKKKTDITYFINMFSKAGMAFVYATAGREQRIVSLLTYFTYRTTTGTHIVDIMTTQADNKTASMMANVKLSKGLGDRMFRDGLIETLKFNGGGYVYAVCIEGGRTGKIWHAHPMSPGNDANFICLQLAMAKGVEPYCTPMSMKI